MGVKDFSPSRHLSNTSFSIQLYKKAALPVIIPLIKQLYYTIDILMNLYLFANKPADFSQLLVVQRPIEV
ncbi:hypothetical protein PWYN_02140 [Paenibacillus wynnii]|uniref:Uncharacterized protein n=1 Tax=Paenibacillus wynnii TaxID=268407 RepID=A0A098MHG1_9BACL|nr:hypothetical protein PWYN_02140 [Paenibacillus wynnii]